MRERPILFSGPMVRALLDGTKTQTRRVVKPPPRGHTAWKSGSSGAWFLVDEETKTRGADLSCPYGAPGDRLWVREAWAIDLCGRIVRLTPEVWPDGWPVKRLRYAADDTSRDGIADYERRSSIFMPRWASRLTLEVTDVRVERLQDISESDARAEGCSVYGGVMDFESSETDGHTAVEDYAALWDSLNAKRGAGWDVNPWVWVLSFRPLSAQNCDPNANAARSGAASTGNDYD